jgi:hypothetical protein
VASLRGDNVSELVEVAVKEIERDRDEWRHLCLTARVQTGVATRRAEQAEAALAACQAERDAAHRRADAAHRRANAAHRRADAAHRRADALVQGTLDAEATLHRLIADQREKREQAEAALAERDAELARLTAGDRRYPYEVVRLLEAERDTAIAKLQQCEAALREARQSVEWRGARLEALQNQQRVMRDPERKMVCDILANGSTMEKPRAEQAEAQLAAVIGGAAGAATHDQ